MLVQALAGYADRNLRDQLDNEAWEAKPVPYLIALDLDGTFLNTIPNYKQAVRGKKTVSVPNLLDVPRSPVPRNAGLYPLLAADDIKYVLGPGPWTKPGQEQNNQERHEAFIHLVQRAAGETQDEGLRTAARFYSRPDQVDQARASLAGAKPGSNTIALAQLNQPIVSRPAVRAHWTKLYRESAADRVAGVAEAECLVTGKIAPISPTHEKIKGLGFGSQPAGVALMSFDKEAFRSYGWDQCSNSPLSPGRAMAYVLAFNHLLRDYEHRCNIGDVAFIFWTTDRNGANVMGFLDRPDPAEIKLLLLPNRDADPDPNMFYMAGVGANGGRMLIRYWVAETLAAIKGHVANWFDQLRIADVFTGEIAEPPSIWRLREAIHRDPDRTPSSWSLALIRRAIEGQPLGYRVLGAALSRLHVSSSRRLDSARAGLIRLCLNDNIRINGKGESPMKETLDPGQKHSAYLCGRMMAVYESLQYSASKNLNETVADRYFSLASTYPKLAFPKLEVLSKSHLRKLRRDNPGAMVRISQDLDELSLQIGNEFPAALDLDGQGRFALGYHHQRAHQMAQAKAHKKQKELDEPLKDDQKL